jgi:hypothetical protein
MLTHDKSSHGLWPGELKMYTRQNKTLYKKKQKKKPIEGCKQLFTKQCLNIIALN